MKNNLHKILLLGLPFALPSAVMSTTVFEDGFSDRPVQDSVSTPGSYPDYYQTVDPATNLADVSLVSQNSPDVFGGGADYLRMTDQDSGDGLQIRGRFLNPDESQANLGSGQMSLRFQLPNVTYATSFHAMELSLISQSSVSNTWDIQIRNNSIRSDSSTTLASLSQDTIYELDLVFNNSGSSIGYAGETLDSGNIHIWLNGALETPGSGVLADISGSPTTFNQFSLSSGNASSIVLDLDNLLVSDTITVVPEASSFSLIAGTLALAGTCLIRRRRR